MQQLLRVLACGRSLRGQQKVAMQNFAPGWWSVTGLMCDMAGVGLLTADLVRLQTHLRTASRELVDAVDEFRSDYGGVSDALGRSAKLARTWRPGAWEMDHVADDEMTQVFDVVREELAETATMSKAIYELVERLTGILGERASDDLRTALVSLRFTIVGLVLIGVGFALQLIGSWPQP